jgi:hypothetical protein
MEPRCNYSSCGSSEAPEGWNLKTRPKGGGGGLRFVSYIPIEREPADRMTRVRLGSYEFKKKGISRFDLRDPYHLAVALTWPQFLAGLLALYLSVNVVFASPFGEHRRPGYSVGLTCGGARPAARSSAMICCRHSMPSLVKAVPPSSPTP